MASPSTTAAVGQIADSSADVAHDAFSFMRDADPMVVYVALAALVIIVALIALVVYLIKRKPEMVPTTVVGEMVPMKAFMHIIDEQASQYDSLRNSIMETNACMNELSTVVAELTGLMTAFREMLSSVANERRKSDTMVAAE